MESINLPYMGFNLSWHFFEDENIEYAQFIENRIFSTGIKKDLTILLDVLEKSELMHVTYFLDDNHDRIEVANCNDLFEKVERLIGLGELRAEITSIGGFGVVYFENNETKKQNDLITLDFRLFERSFGVYTDKSVWSPVEINKDFNYNWQVETARLNNHRLSQALQEIHHLTGTSITPGPNEINKDYELWQMGYKIYPSKNVLAIANDNHSIQKDLRDFILEC